MDDFKPKLTDDADDAERRAADLVREGLAGLRLEAKIAEVAATRRAWLRRRFRQRAIALGIGLLMLGALAFWVSRRTDSHTPSIPPEKTPVSPQHIENQVPTTPPQQQAPAPQQPIAAGEKPSAATNSRAPAPTIRGENEVDEKRKARLAQVWAVEYPPAGFVANAHFRQLDSLLKIKSFGTAYARLQRLERTLPANDTLLLMQGFCLLELGEGSEAAGRFGQLADKPTSWQPSARWHRALGLLSAGRDAEALRAFKTIAGTAGDPFRERARRAAWLLE